MYYNMQKRTLKLIDVAVPFRFRMNKRTSLVVYLSELLDDRYRYEIDWDVYLPTYGVNLQRPFVWNEHQKSELIISILEEIPIPPLSVIFYDHKIFKIIDGKQRLSAMIGFLKGEFPITFNGEKYYFEDFDKESKLRVAHYNPIADIAYEYPDELISDDEKIRWFLYVNYSGTPQNHDYLNNLSKLINHEA